MMKKNEIYCWRQMSLVYIGGVGGVNNPPHGDKHMNWINEIELENDEWIIRMADVFADADQCTLEGGKVESVYCYSQHRDLTADELRDWLADSGKQWLVEHLMSEREKVFFTEESFQHPKFSNVSLTEWDYNQYDPYQGQE